MRLLDSEALLHESLPMTFKPPFWTAQRHGQDWVDDDILRAITWMTEAVRHDRWAERVGKVEATFSAARDQWQQGKRVPLFDLDDLIAWYVFQANAHASQQENWFEPEAYRIAPVFRRIGQLVPTLNEVEGIDVRLEALMTGGRKQPDQALYELLVAGAYRQRGWTHVAFVPERKGGPRTHDLAVRRGRSLWAVECKRLAGTGYEADERSRAEHLADEVHQLCASKNESLVLHVRFRVELSSVPDGYLAERALAFLQDGQQQWDDEIARGALDRPQWGLVEAVLDVDDVFYGGSRLVELLVGQWLPHFDHSVRADWDPAPGRPFFATQIHRASVVSWSSDSLEAATRKAKHFRALVAGALNQLPGDRPAAIHVGYEARNGNAVDELRHPLNAMEMRTFRPEQSRLRWVYANYMTPERTTERLEAAAISETTATYAIGSPSSSRPLPNHLLFQDGEGVPGNHWWAAGARRPAADPSAQD